MLVKYKISTTICILLVHSVIIVSADVVTIFYLLCQNKVNGLK